MAEYKKRHRQGWMIYHEDVYGLIPRLTGEECKRLLIELNRFSMARAKGEPYSKPDDFTRLEDYAFEGFAIKIDRDNQKFIEICERRSKNKVMEA